MMSNSGGLVDQERKININGLTPNNVRMLIELMKDLDIDEEVASMVSYSILDWKDLDKARHHVEYGAEKSVL